VEEYVLNISSYTAKIEVTVESNKNVNKYVLKQEYNQQEEKQTVLEPSNIAGLETTYNEGKLTINNTKLNLQTIYEQYENAINNNLWLSSFIKDYQQSSEKNIKEDEDNFIMTTQVENGNEYVYTKILYINKETGNPTKMYIQDKNQKNAVYILYNEIKINS
jgi:outer membrane lipoprotein-sorting protein